MNEEKIGWFRLLGYTIVSFVLFGVICAAVAFGTVIALPAIIGFLVYEYHREKPEPDD